MVATVVVWCGGPVTTPVGVPVLLPPPPDASDTHRPLHLVHVDGCRIPGWDHFICSCLYLSPSACPELCTSRTQVLVTSFAKTWWMLVWRGERERERERDISGHRDGSARDGSSTWRTWRIKVSHAVTIFLLIVLDSHETYRLSSLLWWGNTITRPPVRNTPPHTELHLLFKNCTKFR